MRANPHCILAMALTAALAAFAAPARPDSGASASRAPRDIRTFQPRQGDVIDAPAAQVVQLLLDRQEREGHESYMVQVLFRGKPPARHAWRILPGRVEIDFFDAGKPSMRVGRIRGGAIEATSLEELFYRAPAAGAAGGPAPQARIKRMVRLTLFTEAKPELKFRDTLDRTLIHFKLPKH